MDFFELKPFRFVLLSPVSIFLALAVMVSFGCGVKGPPIAPEDARPGFVEDLSVCVREGRVVLEWSLPTRTEGGGRLSGLAGFVVYRRDEFGGPFSPLRRIDAGLKGFPREGGGKISHIDQPPHPGRRYAYRVTPFTAAQVFGPPSTVASLFWDAPPAPPPGPSCRREGEGALIVWCVPSDEAASQGPTQDDKGFNLYRRRAGKDYPVSPLNGTPLEVCRYFDGEVEHDKAYRYVVRATRSVEGTVLEGESSPECELDAVEALGKR